MLQLLQLFQKQQGSERGGQQGSGVFLISGIHKWSLRWTGPRIIKNIPPWSYPDTAAAEPAGDTSAASAVCV